MYRELVDIKAGKLTYGQRIEVGQILSGPMSEADKFCQSLRCMFGEDYKVTWSVEEVRIFEQIIDGVKFWVEKETEMLKYDPTPEEVQAGCKQLSEKLGPMSTIMALAHKFGKDPDEITQWEYGKVFGLLYADLEQTKYERRYHKVIEAKSRAGRRRMR